MKSNVPDILALDPHARAIGHLCVWWAQVERFVDLLVAASLDLEPMSDKANCITANADFKGKITMVRTLALIKVGTKRQLSRNWYAKLDTALTLIDSNFRLKRNRFVHDIWQACPEHKEPHTPIAIKTHCRTKIERPQSFQLRLTTSESAQVSDDEIWALIVEIQLAVSDLNYCLTRLESPEEAFSAEIRTSRTRSCANIVPKRSSAT